MNQDNETKKAVLIQILFLIAFIVFFVGLIYALLELKLQHEQIQTVLQRAPRCSDFSSREERDQWIKKHGTSTLSVSTDGKVVCPSVNKKFKK